MLPAVIACRGDDGDQKRSIVSMRIHTQARLGDSQTRNQCHRCTRRDVITLITLLERVSDVK